MDGFKTRNARLFTVYRLSTGSEGVVCRIRTRASRADAGSDDCADDDGDDIWGALSD